MQTIINMLIREHKPAIDNIQQNLKLEQSLETTVKELPYPRDYIQHKKANKETITYLISRLSNMSELFIEVQGEYRNLVVGWGNANDYSNRLLIGAHYDGPGDSPAADDNGSAVATLIHLIEMLSVDKPSNVLFVFFNAEEYGLLGSKDFVKQKPVVNAAIILEMVGYYSDVIGSQNVPKGFPNFDKGDFLAIISNSFSKNLASEFLEVANQTSSLLPLKNLHIPAGIEKLIPSLSDIFRSDHAPFWEAGIPAFMATDTANFRNKNYHNVTDTPDTLNYSNMSYLVNLLYDVVMKRRFA